MLPTRQNVFWIVPKCLKLSQNVPKCHKMSQNAHFRRIVVRTDLFFFSLQEMDLEDLYFFPFWINTPWMYNAKPQYNTGSILLWKKLSEKQQSYPSEKPTEDMLLLLLFLSMSLFRLLQSHSLAHHRERGAVAPWAYKANSEGVYGMPLATLSVLGLESCASWFPGDHLPWHHRGLVEVD